MKKKITSFIMLTLIAVLTIVQFGGSSFADGNIGDTYFSYDFDFKDDKRLTESREKRDDTSHYMYPYIKLDGSYVVNGVGCNTWGVVKTEYNQYARTISYIDQYGIMNLCYEEGYPYARLRGKSLSGDFTAAGNWSPDSIPW